MTKSVMSECYEQGWRDYCAGRTAFRTGTGYDAAYRRGWRDAAAQASAYGVVAGLAAGAVFPGPDDVHPPVGLR